VTSAGCRVVLDTNVLVATAYNPGSASRRVIEACLRGELTAILSPALRSEYGFILPRAAHGQTMMTNVGDRPVKEAKRS
jgi:predicted nucleic acid-binding protein